MYLSDWTDTMGRTRAGLPLRQAVDSMQTYIRRGEADRAIDLAYDIYRTSETLMEQLWYELERAAIESVGLADPYALDYVYQMRRICYDCEDYAPESGGMMALCLIHAIRYLSACPMGGGSGEALREIRTAYARGEKAVIPDFAVDHHNHAGREKGATPLSFLEPEGGSKVVPEVPSMAAPYRARLAELLTPEFGGEHPQKFRVSGYNHFYECTSVSGLNMELMQSAFQKSIRRGLSREALMLTYEAACSGWELESYLWQRIVIMSVEDIGMGDPQCGRLMYTFYRVKDHFRACTELRMQALFQAVLYLCACRKERSTELRKGILVRKFASGYVPELVNEEEMEHHA